ncbi:ribosome biogenesis GTP-binding protein YihA/YsxC [Leptospira wolffii]|uniref:Probable GTP-binding protein EngB n=1 Tax=Leptospira wolffii TaxID=409998 RepID=A0A2M9ZEQ2_9LEPT|nr:ribosome biogenesis GTP-binding protein YihA/YsxC [Leptospira wolffii]EPG64799.1 ribosome biogenesis GTP-binding protein YsxC [Leptospira wolffii serovar Khorat str. Khorat-H2]PJZ66842.1 YihA family ribosome biogenesis GTP-binding protein [Leptospira wolffii]TGK61814.1 YihA family ribosome biogenesis GTP-binding protein [Leptospira wolffii]TGK65901.1 YihA family ribosome biogenesis GTP-binding protein [Leptospira wolffii]TGK74802.1 YihA family ribosome biogenesis GTP-binding protein [Leptos
MEEIQELKPDPFFRDVKFYSSYADAAKVPVKGVPHIAFAGRSNSGKSRLLNAIVERKSLAKVSATPGKTKLLNFFLVSKSLFLVDTPGFGYSANSHKDHEQMMDLLMNYLNSAKDLKCLFLLSDAQRDLPEEELELIGTCFEKGTKPVLIRTKIDKLNQSELSKLRKKMKNIQGLYPMLEIVLVSPKYGKGLPELRKIIETLMKSIVVPAPAEDPLPEEIHEQA